MSDNQTYNVKVIKNKLRDLYYHIQYIGNQPLEVGGATAYIKKKLASSDPLMICRLGAEGSRTAVRWMKNVEYSRAAQPPVQCGVSHLSRRTEPHCL